MLLLSVVAVVVVIVVVIVAAATTSFDIAEAAFLPDTQTAAHYQNNE